MYSQLEKNNRYYIVLQVCVRCIFRMFGAFSQACSCASLTLSVLHSFLEEHDDSAKSGSSSCFSTDEACCSVCFGILLPTCHQDDGVALFDDISRTDIITSMVSQAVQREGYQIDEFSLEISLPAVLAANERAIRYHFYLRIFASVFLFTEPQVLDIFFLVYKART